LTFANEAKIKPSHPSDGAFRSGHFADLFANVGWQLREREAADLSLLGLDIGSTGVKAVAFNPEGEILAQAYREYPEVHGKPGWLELDAAEVWNGIVAVLNEVAEATGDDPVQSLCMSAMGETFTPVGADGEFLYNSIISPDSRALDEAASWRGTLGSERVFEITGMPLHPSFTLNKLMWMRRNMPDVHEQVDKYLLWPDVVMRKLGLRPRVDYTLCGRTMAFDIRKKRWSEEMLEAAGIEMELLGEPIASGEVVGELGSKGAEITGLPAGCLIVAGGHDQPMNALGAGVTQAGQAVDGMGTVECVTTALDKPVLTEPMREWNYCCYPHVVADMYVTLGYNYTSGDLLRWYRDNFALHEAAEAERNGMDVYDVILSGLPPKPTGVLVLPYLAGSGTPYLDPQASGAFLGLTLSADRKTIVKAIIEGTCYELHLNLTRMAEGGVEIDRLRATGGGSRSPVWLQIKADITGREVVTLNVTESGCLAGAMLGGVAAGVYEGLQDAVDVLVEERESCEPDWQRHEKYAELFEIYMGAWPAISNLAHELRAQE
jgi:xylulokinase